MILHTGLGRAPLSDAAKRAIVEAAGTCNLELDLETGQRVCVIGRLVVEKLWPERPQANPIGETIKINDIPIKSFFIMRTI